MEFIEDLAGGVLAQFVYLLQDVSPSDIANISLYIEKGADSEAADAGNACCCGL